MTLLPRAFTFWYLLVCFFVRVSLEAFFLFYMYLFALLVVVLVLYFAGVWVYMALLVCMVVIVAVILQLRIGTGITNDPFYHRMYVSLLQKSHERLS
ncbi:hypothetical protein V8C26DRAFT_389905 [Trichoderma gracile]